MKPKFYANNFYHVFNRANSNYDLLFQNEENYIYFLKKYRFYCDEVFETIAYCLLPNHFHLLVKVREVEDQNEEEDLKGFQNLSGLLPRSRQISQRISNLCNSYTKSFNKEFGRRGSLFEKPFKAILVDNEKYFSAVVRYIHRNPIHHKIVTDLNLWAFSSYWDYIDLRNGNLPSKNLILSKFNSIQDFVDFTQIDFKITEIEKFIVD